MLDGRRRDDRHNCSIRASFQSNDREGEGILRNISETGLFIEADPTPAIGASVELRIDYEPHPIVVRGEVCWVGKRADDRLGFGVRLASPPPAFAELVSSIHPSLVCMENGVRRVARRIPLGLPVAIECDNLVDTGQLADVSLTGARLDGTTIRPELGAMITIAFVIEGRQEGLELHASVVRETEGGSYAVEFQSMSPELKAALRASLEALDELPVAE